MKEYYEAHITIEEGSPIALEGSALHGKLWRNGDIRAAVEKTGWIYSAIDDDIVLGPGKKHYATRHFNIEWDAVTVGRWLHQAREQLQSAGCQVVRAKIEHVLYDAHVGRDFK